VNEQKICIETFNTTIGYRLPKGNFIVGDNIGVRFLQGDFVGVVGVNGVGKSTFLKTLAGLLPALSGEVRIFGETQDSITLQKMATLISIVLTEKIGGFNLTAFDAVAAGQMPYTNSFHQLKEEHITEIRKAIITCRLNGHEHKQLHELSDGLFQKTMIARALAQNTPVMMLDEPTAYLDYASRHELFLLLARLAKENKCILVSSHDLDHILRYCNKVLIFTPKAVSLIDISEARSNRSFREIAGGFIDPLV
jgi:iron complex transport system ATP-binding protein